MEITYDKSKNLFYIKTKFHENDYPRRLPNRKFSAKMQCWVAPCIRFNCAEIIKWVSADKGIFLSRPAEVALSDSVTGIETKKEKFPVDFEYKTKPYDHQVRGLDFTYNLKYSGYFVEMGLGKSKMALDKLVCHFLEGEINAIVILCPCSIRANWLKELEIHCTVLYKSVIATMKTAKNRAEVAQFRLSKNPKLKVYIVGTESLQLKTGKAVKETSTFIKAHKCAVVVDEAHDIKNPDSARSKNLFDMSRDAVYRIVMTGTPTPNSILDIYGLMHFLDPNILAIGDFWSFKRRYAIIEQMRISEARTIQKIVGYKNVEELLSIIKPFVFQCTKKEALDLPEKIKINRRIELTKDQREMYNYVLKERVIKLDDYDVKVAITHFLSLLTALQRIAGGFVKYDTGNFDNKGNAITDIKYAVPITKNPKLQEIKRIIDDMPDTEQIIIWARFRAEVFLIEQELKGYKTDKFEGSSSVFVDKSIEERTKIREDMDNKKTRYFISTPNSGGTGITLNTVAYVIYYSNNYSYKDKVQSEDRNHRIGQKRTVTYIDLVAHDTIDGKILENLRNKKDMSDYVKECLAKGENPLD